MALHYSAVNGHTAVAEQLIAAGAATDATSTVSIHVCLVILICCVVEQSCSHEIQYNYYTIVKCLL